MIFPGVTSIADDQRNPSFYDIVDSNLDSKGNEDDVGHVVLRWVG
jgi:hypothetical protein